MDRDFHYAETAGPTTAALVVQLQFNATEGDRYAVFATMVVGDVLDPYTALMEGAFGLYVPYDIDPREDVNDYLCMPFFFPHVIPVSGANNFDMRLYGLSLGTPPSSTHKRQAIIAAFKMNELDVTNDNWDTQVDTVTTTDAAGETVAGTEVTFEAPTAGDYWFLISARVDKTLNSSNFDVWLNVDGAKYIEATMRTNTVNYSWPYAGQVKLTLAAGSHTMKMMGKVTTGGTLNVQFASLVALRCDQFPAIHEAHTYDPVTDSSDAYVTMLSLTARLQAQPTLIVSTNIYKRAGTDLDVSARTRLDGADVLESRAQCASTNIEYCHVAIDGLTPSAGDHTILQEYTSYVDGITSAGCDDATIVAATMKDGATVYILGGQILKGQLL